VRHEEQKGYGAACKTGFEMGSNPYVCFMDSDCLVEDVNWLKNMGESLLKLKSDGVRVIAPMTNNPVNGDPAQKGEKYLREDDVIINEDSFLSLPCFMCHRELFSRIGGFLKEYKYGGYEDEEFAHRLKYHKFKQAVCRSSYVYHKGESTIKEMMRKRNDFKDSIKKNREMCVEDMKKFQIKS
jgi:GT2 family glycosyltransferase